MTRRLPIMKASKRVPSTGQDGNARAVKSGVYADLSRRNLDQRSKLARAMREVEHELVTAIGGDPSPQERILIQRVVFKLARLTLFEADSLAGNRGSDEHYLAWSNSLRLDLQAIGLNRKAQMIPNLQDYLKDQQKKGRQHNAAGLLDGSTANADESPRSLTEVKP